MKKSFKLLVVVVVFTLSLISCQKEPMQDQVVAESIKEKVNAEDLLTKEEAQYFIEGGNLKSASMEDDATLVELFPLDGRTTEVYENMAIRYSLYEELNSDGFRRKTITLSQIYEIVDGVVDLSSYELKKEVGCHLNKFYRLESPDNVVEIVYTFHFNNGTQFSYIGENNNGYRIPIPPIADAVCQLSVSYNDGDTRQEYVTDMVNYFYSPDIIGLKIEIKADNTQSHLNIDLEMTQGVYLVQVYSTDGNYVNFRMIYDENLTDVLNFDTPFNEISHVNISSMNGWCQYRVKIASYSEVDGNKVYVLKGQ